MSDLVGIPEDRFSRVAAQIISAFYAQCHNNFKRISLFNIISIKQTAESADCYAVFFLLKFIFAMLYEIETIFWQANKFLRIIIISISFT